jgi:hypothetical protein
MDRVVLHGQSRLWDAGAQLVPQSDTQFLANP